MNYNERFGQIEGMLADLLRRMDRQAEQMDRQGGQMNDIINILKYRMSAKPAPKDGRMPC